MERMQIAREIQEKGEVSDQPYVDGGGQHGPGHI